MDGHRQACQHPSNSAANLQALINKAFPIEPKTIETVSEKVSLPLADQENMKPNEKNSRNTAQKRHGEARDGKQTNSAWNGNKTLPGEVKWSYETNMVE